MPSLPSPKPSSKAGIITSSSGERHIPATTRPDGSIRKEIRVRPGYRPPEDVEVYKNRTAESWKTRGSARIPGAAPVSKMENELTPAAAKNAKRKEAPEEAIKNPVDKQQILQNVPDPPGLELEPLEPLDPEVEKEREVKRLCKKLRQARDLQQKKEKGDCLLPEQFEKVVKISELIRQLDKLGFNTEDEETP